MEEIHKKSAGDFFILYLFLNFVYIERNTKSCMKNKSLVSIDQCSKEDILRILDNAGEFEKHFFIRVRGTYGIGKPVGFVAPYTCRVRFAKGGGFPVYPAK